jgi:hypothetical protein
VRAAAAAARSGAGISGRKNIGKDIQESAKKL